MFTIRNLVILLVVAGLAVIGGMVNMQREGASACADQRFIDFVRPEMVDDGRGKGYLNASIYYSALEGALASDRLDPSLRPDYEAQMATIKEDIESSQVRGREVSPSSKTQLTCLYELEIGDTLVETRFRLTIEKLPGVEFEKLYDKRQRSVVLMQELRPDEPVETVEVAKLGLRQTKLKKFPIFSGARFDQTFTPDVLIREGVISEIPK